MRKTMISTAVLALTLQFPATGWAQEAQGAEEDQGIGEIIVTARKTEENLQDVAIAVDAVTQDALSQAGVTNARDITKLVPSLFIGSGGGNNASLFLRGVGNRTNNSFNDSAIAVSYDGVYVTRAAAVTGAAFYDLERVEVLKGPQGILYGRNATGGVLNVLPAKPKLGDRAAGFSVSAGSYDMVNAQAYLNVPLGENVAARLAATRQVQDGINRDGSDDRDVWGLRGQLLFEPSDTVSIRLAADYTKVGGSGPGNHYVGNFAVVNGVANTFVPSTLGLFEGTNTATANAFRRTLLGAPGFGFLTDIQQKQFIDMEYWGINAEINADLGFGKLTIIPAYRKDSGSVAFVGPAFNTAVNFNRDKQHSLEARLVGDVGPVNWLVGGFYLNDTASQRNIFNQEFVLPVVSYTQKTKSVAAFGQLTWNATDNIRLIGGIRYTRDKKDVNGINNNFITFCGAPPPNNRTPPASFGPPTFCAQPNSLPRFPNLLDQGQVVASLIANGWISPTSTAQPNLQVFPLLNGRGTILKTYTPLADNRAFTNTSYKLSAEFDVTEDNLLYATFSTGYRAGGLQLSEGNTDYEPEFLDSFVIGSKNRFFDNRVQLNIEAFYWKYKDQQITYFTIDPPSGTLINSNENAGRVNIKGFDVDTIFKVTRNTTLSGKFQYLDAKYKDLHLLTASPRDNIGCPFNLVTYGSNPRFPATAANPAGTQVRAGGQPLKDFNCSGRDALYAPKWTVNIGAEQIVPVGSSLELVGRVDTAWRDSQEAAFDFLPFQRIRSFWTTDLNLTLRNPEGGWSFSGYVLNLEDKRRYTFPQVAPSGGAAVTTLTAPRTYGIRLSADF